ncbi:zinc transporter ZIP3 [Trichomycterus rosablanca]|uniref:zinc transporter ZIP3 n=1 Tax=Trichomycterus rosablanca TaxID=2290929 RepID=UPI002F3603EF
MSSAPSVVGSVDVEPVFIVVYLCSTSLSGITALCTVRSAARWGVHSDSRMFLFSCFSAGVFLAISLLDVIPKYLTEMKSTFSDLGVTLRFPVAEFLLAVGFLLLMVMEQMILSLRDDSENQNKDGEEKEGLLVPFPLYRSRPEPWISSVRSFVLLFSLCMFSIFQGLSTDLLQLRPDLLLRTALISVSLIFTLTQNRMRRSATSICLMVLCVAFPLGVALRHTLAHTHVPLRLARSTLEGLCVGSFLYVVFLDVMPRVMSSSEQRILKVTLILTGFTVVTAALLIKT